MLTLTNKNTLLYYTTAASFSLVLLDFTVLSQLAQVINMAAESLSGGVYKMILDPILFTCLLHYWCDPGIVGLYDPREQVMSGLMVEGSSEHGPEPAACGVVLCRSHLELRPTGGGGGGTGWDMCCGMCPPDPLLKWYRLFAMH